MKRSLFCELQFPFNITTVSVIVHGSQCIMDHVSSDSVADRDPVLLVSGMGGSILNARSNSGSDTRVWVRIFLSEMLFKKKVWSLYNPETGYTESLDDSSEIAVPDDDYGLYAIDILDPSWFAKCIHLSDVYHFHDMIDMLVGCGYEKGTTLFGYGYDFRQSNRIDQVLNGLKQKLEAAYEASGSRKVNIISHSMGGLLVTCFMSLYTNMFSKYVNKWIAIACPFQGAPGYINDSLLTGVQFVEGFESYFFVSRWTIHQLLVECPSVYEMLANPDFNWEKQPEIRVWSIMGKRDDLPNVILESLTLSHSVTLFPKQFKVMHFKLCDKVHAIPLKASKYEDLMETEKILLASQMFIASRIITIYQKQNSTPKLVSLGCSRDSPISLGKRIEVWSSMEVESSSINSFNSWISISIESKIKGMLPARKVDQAVQPVFGFQQGFLVRFHKL
nr:phospholipase A(1) LCAT3 [Ipomoea batatas]